MTKSKAKSKSKARALGRADNPTPFGRMLYTMIGRQGMTATAFAQKTDISGGFLSMVYTGQKLPPIARLIRWADALRLTGAERRAFFLLGELEQSPLQIRVSFIGLLFDIWGTSLDSEVFDIVRQFLRKPRKSR